VTPAPPRTPLPGRATPAATARFAARFAHLAPGHFREALGVRWSSIGLGTYLGNPDAAADQGYRDAILAAVAAGCNVIDSAINYRFQASERAVGAALRDACASGLVSRDEIVVCTKGGYIPFDGPPTNARAWVEDTLVTPGVITWSDIVGSNVMRPGYIRHQLAASLENLGLETIDVYYLHNPESQLESLSSEDFLGRMAACFEELELAVSAGMIGAYGVATWDAFRVEETAPSYVGLEELLETATKTAGADHHFKVVQLPLNLGMPEGIVRWNQDVDGDQTGAFDAAARLGITAVASGSLMQGRLSALPDGIRQLIPGALTDVQRALQFVRSTPGVTTALVGMKSEAHVTENLALARVPPMSGEEFAGLFR
jgi:aryl-alcohol dehydrogenase-like predicted oxidoreductase